MPDRWRVRECPEHGLQPVESEFCPTCFDVMSDPFDVVRAQAARSSDPSTSKRAAVMAEPSMESKRGQVLAAIGRVNGVGMTAHEVERVTGIEGAWKRVSELVQSGHLEVIGERVDPQTGKPGRVFALPGGTLF